MSKKGDLFGFLNAVERGDFSYVDNMEEEEVKSISPYVTLMWEGQSNWEIRTLVTNTFCNDMVFSLAKHPRLLLKLFVASGSGLGSTKWAFCKSVTKQESKILKLIATHYNCGYHEAKDIVRLLSDKDIKELKEIYQYDE